MENPHCHLGVCLKKDLNINIKVEDAADTGTVIVIEEVKANNAFSKKAAPYNF